MAINPIDFNYKFGGLTSSQGQSYGLNGNQNGSVSGVDHGLFARKTGEVQGVDGGYQTAGLTERIGRINGELSPVMQDEFRGNRLDLVC